MLKYIIILSALIVLHCVSAVNLLSAHEYSKQLTEQINTLVALRTAIYTEMDREGAADKSYLDRLASHLTAVETQGHHISDLLTMMDLIKDEHAKYRLVEIIIMRTWNRMRIVARYNDWNAQNKPHLSSAYRIHLSEKSELALATIFNTYENIIIWQINNPMNEAHRKSMIASLEVLGKISMTEKLKKVIAQSKEK